MNDGDPDIVRAAMFEAIEYQVKVGTPPETAQTLDRLRNEGYTHDEAMRLIASVLASEVVAVANGVREYDDGKAYAKALAALPKLPRE